ncbi:hypothetical protein HQ545_01780 [Candidatus Woesearchaeota archaeon]|nr:hypothetical protein [Candidatus Woesearchaeota archaeon]
MKWVRQYKRKISNADNVINRMRKRESRYKKRDENNKLREILPEQHFILNDGTKIKNIEELAILMDRISDEDFSFHVQEDKNDFSNWIRDVFKNPEMAEELEQIKDQRETQIFLLKNSLYERDV